MVSKEGLRRGLELLGLAFILGDLNEETISEKPQRKTKMSQPVGPSKEEPKTIQPRYRAYEGQYGLVVEVDGYVLGSLFDQPFFRRDWFDKDAYPGALEILVAAENIAQPTLKESGPRINSGAPGYDHIRRVVEKITKSAESLGISLDLRTMIPGILHDDIEERVKALYKLWEKYVVLAHHETHPKSKHMYEVLRDLSGTKLNEKRLYIRNRLEGLLMDAIPEYPRGHQRQRLRQDIPRGTSSVLRLTRYTEKYKYPESMEVEFGRYGNEPLSSTFARKIGRAHV